MYKVSVICMIYKSVQFAEWVYQSIHKHTPMIERGEAEFFFVANDPTKELVDYLREKKYPFVVALHDKLSSDELQALGYENREYLRRVYQAWNQGILHAKGEMICLVNSDNSFSENWLENLIKYSDYNRYVVPQLVEPKQRGGVFWCAINKEFGSLPEDFKENEFIQFADKIRKTGIRQLGVFQPCLFYKDVAIMAGLYPEGNRINVDGSITTGDTAFRDKLLNMGVQHITALDSIVYHMGEGEMKDTRSKEISMCDRAYAGENFIPMYTHLAKAELKKIYSCVPQVENADAIIENLVVPYDDNPDADAMCEKLKNEINDDMSSKIYLYCAGRNGKKLHRNLFIRGIDIGGYIDSNEALWGTLIDTKKCYSLNDIGKENVIIVTKDHPEDVVKILQEKGYKKILTSEDIACLLLSAPAIKENRLYE